MARDLKIFPNLDKDIIEIAKHLKENYGWDVEKISDTELGLFDYTIKATKDVLINTPSAGSFLESVKTEMAHQLQKHGDESNKFPHDFALVLNYLNGKLIKAIWEGDLEKYKHHLDTIAAVAGTAKKYLSIEKSKSQKWFIKDNPIKTAC